MSRGVDTTPGSRWNHQQIQAFNIEDVTIENAAILPAIRIYISQGTLNAEVESILGKIRAHQIRAGSEQELRKAVENTWLYPFFFFLANSSKEYCYPPSQGTPHYEKREQITMQQNDFVSGEGFSSPLAQDS